MSLELLEVIVKEYFTSKQKIKEYKANRNLTMIDYYHMNGYQQRLNLILNLMQTFNIDFTETEGIIVSLSDSKGIRDNIEISNPESFEKLYPQWAESTAEGKYKNLPARKFIIVEEVSNKIVWCPIDNTSYDAWTEEFETLAEAIKYLI